MHRKEAEVNPEPEKVVPFEALEKVSSMAQKMKKSLMENFIFCAVLEVRSKFNRLFFYQQSDESLVHLFFCFKIELRLTITSFTFYTET